MRNRNYSFLLFFLFRMSFFAVFAIGHALALPTVESLLKNGSNPDITNNFIQLQFRVSAVGEGAGLGQSPAGGYNINFDEMSNGNGVSMDFLVGSDFVDFWQTFYSDLSFAKEKRVTFFERPRFSHFLQKEALNSFPKDFFYSVIFSLVLNKSDVLTSYLKRTSPNFRDNRSLVDEEKLRHYRQKESALLISKNSGGVAGSGTANSPEKISPRNETTLSNRSYYLDNKQVELIKEKKQLYLKVEMDNFYALFSNDKHQMINIRSIVKDREFEMELREFILFNGTHAMPKYIILKKNQRPFVYIETLKLTHSTKTESKIREEQRAFFQDLKKNENIKSHDYEFLF